MNSCAGNLLGKWSQEAGMNKSETGGGGRFYEHIIKLSVIDKRVLILQGLPERYTEGLLSLLGDRALEHLFNGLCCPLVKSLLF